MGKDKIPVQVVYRVNQHLDYNFSDMTTVTAVSKGNLIPAGRRRISDLRFQEYPLTLTQHLYV